MNTFLKIPARIAALPKDDHGRPVPWFVCWIDQKPDFRVIGPGKIADAYRFKLCWICGQRLGKFKTFVIGPMCALNRISAEPPSHRECAIFAVRACPFLSTPQMHRRTRDLPTEGVHEPGGIGLKRNPGVSLVWTTSSYAPLRAPNGYVFRIGDPTELLWFKEGRTATREEILESIDSGVPILREVAQQDGPKALAALDASYQEAMKLLP
jgi:hypothetical protein